jgi:glutathione synthase/RimK-type ligase-like ATP-grasp enzyme
LISGARAPVALGFGRAFAAAGYEVHFVDSVDSLMVRWSSFGGEGLHHVPPPKSQFGAFRKAIRALVAELDPCLIIPTCEEVFYLSQAADLDNFSERLFAPLVASLRRLHSKAEFAQLARECGLNPPRTWRVTCGDDLRAFEERSGELVFKPEFSRFGAETLIRPARNQVKKLRVGSDKPWVIQEYLSGEEVCVWAAARAGELVAAAGYRPKWHFGGASAYFERDDDPRLIEACAKLAAHTGATGQLSLDLIRTPEGMRPIECNPRAVSGVQLFDGERTLAEALVGEHPELLTPRVEACHVGAAFWLAAVGRSVRRGGLAEARRDASKSREVLTRSGGLGAPVGAMLDAARFALKGARAGRSSIKESTADIEWNGEPIA